MLEKSESRSRVPHSRTRVTVTDVCGGGGGGLPRGVLRAAPGREHSPAGGSGGTPGVRRAREPPDSRPRPALRSFGRTSATGELLPMLELLIEEEDWGGGKCLFFQRYDFIKQSWRL